MTTLENFKIVAPEELMLPDFPGELPGYDPTEKPGYRCAWIVHWMVANGPDLQKVIGPRVWRFNGVAPDLALLPDEYLLAALQDVADRNLGGPSEEAKHILRARYSGWQSFASQLLLRNLSEAPRVSQYNPPRRKAFTFYLPDEFKDRVLRYDPEPKPGEEIQK